MKLGPNQTAWVQALRSGKYEQGKKRLRVGDSFCCLGVACDISGAGEWHPKTGGYWTYSEHGSRLPGRVVQQLRLRDASGGFTSSISFCEFVFRSLTELNDAGMPFAEIADIIEERADELFEASA